MLIATGIHKNYGELQILKGVDLHVKESEIVSIVGSSGAGKTTLLQILGTLDNPDNGTLTINNIDPFSLSSNKMAAFRNKQIGFIFQFHQLLQASQCFYNSVRAQHGTAFQVWKLILQFSQCFQVHLVDVFPLNLHTSQCEFR